jgi:hypothetical protein
VSQSGVMKLTNIVSNSTYDVFVEVFNGAVWLAPPEALIRLNVTVPYIPPPK